LSPCQAGRYLDVVLTWFLQWTLIRPVGISAHEVL